MSYINIYIYFIFFISTGLTVCYTFRLLYYTIFGSFFFNPYHSLGDHGLIILKGIGGLIFMVILGGRLLRWLIFPFPYFICLPLLLKLITLLVIFLGVWLGIELSKFSLNYSSLRLNWLIRSLFFSSIWNIPHISTLGINFYPLNFGGFFYKQLDQGWSEYFGGQNLYKNLKSLSVFSQFVFNNNLKIYLSLLVIWIIYLLVYFI